MYSFNYTTKPRFVLDYGTDISYSFHIKTYSPGVLKKSPLLTGLMGVFDDMWDAIQRDDHPDPLITRLNFELYAVR